MLLDLLGPARLTRVLDIGANPVEPAPYSQLKDMGACEVWGFEPQPEAYQQVAAMAGPNEHYLCAAVGDGTPTDLHVCGTSNGFTSTLEPDPAFVDFVGRFREETRVTEVLQLETRRLDDLDLPEVDLLKIDIQGGETKVFDHGRRVLAGAKVVITEVAMTPIYKGQPLFDVQMGQLLDSGYGMHKFLFLKTRMLNRPTSAKLGMRYETQLLDGDAVFVRHLTALHEQDDEALKHLAVLADAVFESFDLVRVVLDELLKRGVIAQRAVDAYMRKVWFLHQPGLRWLA